MNVTQTFACLGLAVQSISAAGCRHHLAVVPRRRIDAGRQVDVIQQRHRWKPPPRESDAEAGAAHSPFAMEHAG